MTWAVVFGLCLLLSCPFFFSSQFGFYFDIWYLVIVVAITLHAFCLSIVGCCEIERETALDGLG